MPHLQINGREAYFLTPDPQYLNNPDRVRPLVLFVHGAGTDSHRWRYQVQALGRSLFCLAIDLPFHGDSGDMADFITITAYANFIEALWHDLMRRCPKLGGLIVVGEQMGAAVALEFALRRPPSLKGLVLASVGCRVAIPKEWLASPHQA